MAPDWRPVGAQKDRQSVTAEWDLIPTRLISGVIVRHVKHVPTSNGVMTEIYRRNWFNGESIVDQIFQASLEPEGISAWHAHEFITDRLFVSRGSANLVLYDGRSDSPTCGLVNKFILGSYRPLLIIVPPKIWHGVQNLGSDVALIVNAPDHAYHYADPDHWRLPVDTTAIPYQFSSSRVREIPRY